MSERRPRDQFRSLGSGLLGLGLVLALAAVVALVSPRATQAQVPAEAGTGALNLADVGKAVTGLAELGEFYATLAANDPNRHAATAWRQRHEAYSSAAVALADLLTQGRIAIADLPGTTTSRVDQDKIVLDTTLGGRWQPAIVRSTRRVSGDEWPFVSELSTVLLQAYLAREPGALSGWMAEQQRRSTVTLSTLAADRSQLEPAQARYWHIKDKYFWMSMAARAEPGTTTGRLSEARTAHLQAEFLVTMREFRATFGEGFGAALERDWRDYQKSVAGFASTRAWLTSPEGAAPRYAKAGPFEATVDLAKARGGATTARPEPRAIALQTATEAAPAPVKTLPPGQAEQQLAALARAEELEGRITVLESQLEGRHGEIGRLREELETQRAQARREDQLVAELAAVRTETTRLEDRSSQLQAELAESLASNEQLAARIETGRTDIALLRDELAGRDAELTRLREALETEAAANQDALASLGTEIAEERRAFEARIAELRKTFESEITASEQTADALRERMEEERRMHEAAQQAVEARLSDELEANRQTVAALRADLESGQTERRAGAEGAAEREAALLAQVEQARRAAAETEERLMAMLELSRQEVARLGEQLAFQSRDSAKLPRGPVTAAAVVLIMLLLVLFAVVLTMRRQIVQLRGPAMAAGFHPGAQVDSARDRLFPPPEQSAGQEAAGAAKAISPQALVEALRQGKVETFEQRLAAMAELREDQVWSMVRDPGGERLAVLCRGIGIDKLGFASIFLLSRKALEKGEEVAPRDLSKAMAVYDGTSAEQAGEQLRVWQAEANKPAMVERLMVVGGTEEGVPSQMDDSEPDESVEK